MQTLDTTKDLIGPQIGEPKHPLHLVDSTIYQLLTWLDFSIIKHKDFTSIDIHHHVSGWPEGIRLIEEA